eukprot:TRINITY_DN9484_c0_g2_i3.p1 TRINITY_DN9484_c0_g2~~TRINITY_DN9484_c0_g2_i3.p1  ORF type:complete len:394 (-),score=62.13 TRINITY_DN9484_c0_g2_i3:200-1381(-)
MSQSVVSGLNCLAVLSVDATSSAELKELSIYPRYLLHPLRSTTPHIAVAALRAAATIFHPSVCEYSKEEFEQVGVEIVAHTQSKDTNIEAKAYWALACIFETFVKRSLHPPYLPRLLQPSFDLFSNKNVKSIQHAIRLAGFLFIVSEAAEVHRKILDSLQILLESDSDKIRGTVCYTYGSILQFADNEVHQADLEEIQRKLLSILREKHVIKVKILAAQGLMRSKQSGGASECLVSLHNYITICLACDSMDSGGDQKALEDLESQLLTNIDLMVSRMMSLSWDAETTAKLRTISPDILRLLRRSLQLWKGSVPDRCISVDADDSCTVGCIPIGLSQNLRRALLQIHSHDVDSRSKMNLAVRQIFSNWLQRAAISHEYLPQEGFGEFLADLNPS